MKGHRWTAADDAYLKAVWGRKPDEEVAANVPSATRSVRGCEERAKRLGINRGSDWSQADEEFLQDWWGRRSDKWVATNLPSGPRSNPACKQRAYKLGICRRMNMFTAREAAALLGLDRGLVRQLIAEGTLHAIRSVISTNIKWWRIEAVDLERFIKRHPQLYDYRDIDRDEYPYWRNLAERVQRSAKVEEAGRPGRIQPTKAA